MKFVLISIGVLGVAFILFMGEPAWLIFLCVLIVRALFSSRHLALRCAIVISSVAILTAHFAGYKVYGSATVHDNRPVLNSPHEVASLAAPNIILTTDGNRIAVRGVTFTPELLAMPFPDAQSMINRGRGTLLIQVDANSPSGVLFQRRFLYWCGNTFFPTFIPERLPAYSAADLGEYFRGCNLATAEVPR